MKRLLLLGVLLGVVNALAALAALYAVHRAAPDEFGWFAYAPAGEDVVVDLYGFPWEYVAVPAVLLAVNAVLVPVAARRGWLRPQR